MEGFLDRIICGDCREVLKRLPEESIHMVMFSPPYWGLRNYGAEAESAWGGDPSCRHEWGGAKFCTKCGAWRGQLGLEPDFRMYIQHLVEVMREVRRVLRRDGSAYIVLGDTYAGRTALDGLSSGSKGEGRPPVPRSLEKCKLLIPHRVAIALVDDGWIVRNDIVWYKPNHLPSSVKDRLTNAYEFVFHLTRSRRYYYDLDAIREPHTSIKDLGRTRLDTKTPKYDLAVTLEAGKVNPTSYLGQHPLGKNPGDVVRVGFTKHDLAVGRVDSFSYPDPLHARPYHPLGRNPGDFWEIPARPFKGAHFATYPPELCVRPILSSCPPGGVVLDPMCGSGTTLLVAKALGRHFIGIEIVPGYVEMARRRVAKVAAPLAPITNIRDALVAVREAGRAS